MKRVIEVQHLSKEYRRYRRPFDRIKEILPLVKPRYTPFLALDDVSFAIDEGETVGIIGQNGAGKSTLLQILAGVLEPSSGEHRVEGRVGSLLELGAGFHPDFRGIDNVRLQGQLLGLSTDYVEERLERILAFADIGDFVEQPVKNYSSGMFVRLAFSTAIHFEPELLIIDEALSVGDVFFQHKCMERMKRFQEMGKTILVVSHDPQTIRHICNRAIHIRQGHIVGDGDPGKIVARFLQERSSTFSKAESDPLKDAGPAQEAPPGEAWKLPTLGTNLERHGEGGARVLAAGIVDDQGHLIETVESAREIRLRMLVETDRELRQSNLGFMMRDKKGLDVTGSNLAFEEAHTPYVRAGGKLQAEFRIELPELPSGSYSFSLAVAEGDAQDYRILEWVENACILQIYSQREILGHMRLRIEVEIQEIRAS